MDSIEHRFIFYPERDLIGRPDDLGLPYDDVWFRARDDVKLDGWFIPAPADADLGRVTMLWLHGNAGNISHRLDNIAAFHHRLGVNQFIIDYRGYGGSEGTISERGSYLDGHGAVDYLLSRPGVELDRLICFGRSLGGAVAAELALEHRFAGLILESTFTNVAAIAKQLFPFLPVNALSTKYDTLAKMPRIAAPLLVLHGDRDELLPYQLGQSVFNAANEPKRFHTILGAGHNDTYVVGGDAYYDALRSFISECAARK